MNKIKRKTLIEGKWDKKPRKDKWYKKSKRGKWDKPLPLEVK